MSMQYSVGLSKLPAVAAKLRQALRGSAALRRDWSERVVEVKFLAGSTRTLIGPNAPTGFAKSGSAPPPVAAVNVYWALPEGKVNAPLVATHVPAL